jgi:hypothetical protein
MKLAQSGESSRPNGPPLASLAFTGFDARAGFDNRNFAWIAEHRTTRM